MNARKRNGRALQGRADDVYLGRAIDPGNMFTLLHQSRLAIRLPEEEREKFVRKYKTMLSEAYGTVMKEYVAVPDDQLQNTKELKKYLDRSYEYAKTLKPKPTTKKKH